MKTIRLTHRLPWEAHDIFRLIMRVDHFKDIYPMVSSARILKEDAVSKELELVFHLGNHLPFADPVERSRITWVKDREIHARSIKGPFKTLNLDWTLEPLKTGGTQVSFDMVYDTGKGFLANALVEPFVRKAVHDTLTRFEAYAARTLEPLADRKSQKPARTTPKSRRRGDPQP